MSSYEARRPLAWVVEVVEQLTQEMGLARSATIEDLVMLTYVGQLDSPDPNELSRERLLSRCRSVLVTWAWEQGQHDEAIPTSRLPVAMVSRGSAGAPCGALLSQ
jgi:hypothetical protein